MSIALLGPQVVNTYNNILDQTDYTFYNKTIIFNGSYSEGSSECAVVTVVAHTDGLVEGTEVIIVGIGQMASPVSVFIIDSDCKLTMKFKPGSQYFVGPCNTT